MPSRILDVAVVGGGVSGAYAAWRLKDERPDLKVGLFEYSDRIGGRLYTRRLPGMRHVLAELGGMRYIPKTQAFVTNLVGFLELPSVEFLMGDPRPPEGDPGGKPVGADNNIYYLRQKFIRARDLTRPGEIPYAVSWSERGLDPDQLQARALEYLVPNRASLTPDEWFKVKVFGRRMYKFGFWDLLFRVLTNEAYAFMKAAGGYDANVANSNAVFQFPTGEYGPGVEYRTLRDGFQNLPRTLVRRLEAAAPGSVSMNHRLASIDKRDGIYLLRFQLTRNEKRPFYWSRVKTARIRDIEPEQHVDVRTRRVILAMPRRALELIDWEGWKDPEVFKLRESVLSQAALKLFLGYEAPWWRALGLYAGRSITDLPIRQVYYLGTERDHPGADPANYSSLLMASYNDIGTVPFWKATENDQPFKGYPTKFTPHGKSPIPIGQAPVTRGMVELAQNQLREMHGQVSITAPYTAIFHDWTDDPYGGGWHEWKAGVPYNKVMPRIRRPVPTEDIFICGEAYSSKQGWVEGALQTTEKLLEDHFGLTRPSWLPADYDLSW